MKATISSQRSRLTSSLRPSAALREGSTFGTQMGLWARGLFRRRCDYRINWAQRTYIYMYGCVSEWRGRKLYTQKKDRKKWLFLPCLRTTSEDRLNMHASFFSLKPPGKKGIEGKREKIFKTIENFLWYKREKKFPPWELFFKHLF